MISTRFGVLSTVVLALLTGTTVLRAAAMAPETVTFPTQDGALIEADLYGGGTHAVVLAHGGRFDKESWVDQARVLAEAGLRVMAINFRGYGESRPPEGATDHWDGLHFDVLAAVRYLRAQGASEVSVIGGSIGGWAAARASAASGPGEIDRLILLAHSPIDHPERMKGRKLFIIARDDPNGDGSLRLPAVRDQFERAPEPKELVVLEGSAHAQWIFGTEQGDELMEELLRFLTAP